MLDSPTTEPNDFFLTQPNTNAIILFSPRAVKAQHQSPFRPISCNEVAASPGLVWCQQGWHTQSWLRKPSSTLPEHQLNGSREVGVNQSYPFVCTTLQSRTCLSITTFPLLPSGSRSLKNIRVVAVDDLVTYLRREERIPGSECSAECFVTKVSLANQINGGVETDLKNRSRFDSRRILANQSKETSNVNRIQTEEATPRRQGVGMN